MTNFTTEAKCEGHGVCGALPYGQWGSWGFEESASWNAVDDWRPNMTTEAACIPA